MSSSTGRSPTHMPWFLRHGWALALLLLAPAAGLIAADWSRTVTDTGPAAAAAGSPTWTFTATALGLTAAAALWLVIWRILVSVYDRRVRKEEHQVEAEVWEREIRYRRLFEMSRHAILVLERGHFVECNQAAVTLYGCQEPADLVGRTTLDFSPERQPDGANSADLANERIASALVGRPQFFEWRHCRPDGEEFDAEVELAAFESGGKTLMHAIVHDITERRKAEERIRDLNRMLQTTSQINQLIVRESDPQRLLEETCRILVEFAGFRMAWFARPDPVTGETHPITVAGGEEGFLALAAVRCDNTPHGRGPTGTALRERRTAVVQDLEQDTRTDPWVELSRMAGFRSAASLPLLVQNRLAGAFTIYAGQTNAFTPGLVAKLEELAGDLSFALGAIAANRQRREAERRYRDLFEHSPIGIYQTTPDGRILAANPALLEMLEYVSFEELSHRNLQKEGFSPESPRGEYLQQLEAEGEVRGLEAVWQTRTGRRLVVRENARVVRGDMGEVLCFEGTVEDITERRAVEEQLFQTQKMEAVGRLAGGVAHDFNNLLQAVWSLLEVLRTHIDDADRSIKVLGELDQHVRRGAALTRQLLLFSRQETARPEPLEFNTVVEETSQFLRRLLRENIAMDLETDAQAFPVRADRGQLGQILTNLVVNAADAMPDGGTLTLRTGGNSAAVWLSVKDTGVGICEDIQSRIFEPFFTTKEAGRGTGLGLSVVHGIVTQHGGTIEVNSSPGNGAEFVVRLPRLFEDIAPLSIQTPEFGEPFQGSGQAILVVEDEPAAREGVTELLGVLGYQAAGAASGEEALELAAGRRFDLLLSDLLLPGISGPELAKELLERSPGTRVVFMSGYAEDEVVRRGVKTGDMRFLQKPFDMATLARELHDAFSGQSPAAAEPDSPQNP